MIYQKSFRWAKIFFYMCLAAETPLFSHSAFAQTVPPQSLLPPVTNFTTQPDSPNSSGPRWQFSLFAPALGQASAEGIALKFHVTQVNGPIWHAQLKYPAPVLTGQTYELKFRAKSDVPVTLTDTSEHFPADYTTEHQLLKVTPEWKTFTFRFVALDTVDTKNILPVYFCGQQPSTVRVENASLTTLPVGSILNLPVTNLSAWRLSQWGKDGNGVYHLGLGEPVVMTTDGTATKIAVSGQPDQWVSWQSSILLHESTTYTLRFRAKADQDRTMDIGGELDTMGTPANGLDLRVKLTPDWQFYQTTFTTKSGMNGVNQVPEFMVSGPPSTVWLEDVTLMKGRDPYLAPEADPVVTPRSPVSGPRPRSGEIKLVGTVMEVHAASKSLLLAVTTVTQPDGTTVTLATPRPKTVLVNTQTLLATSDLTQKALADVTNGASITVIGKDAGVGKTLTARTILLP